MGHPESRGDFWTCLSVALPFAAEVARGALGRSVEVAKATLFRKSEHAALGTHGHQDAAYWVRPNSRRYGATTWLALDPVSCANGALRVLPGSHRGPVGPPVDYLREGFVDPAAAWGRRSVTLDLAAGDAVTFHPVLWHASWPCLSGQVRRSLAIRWAGGDDIDVPAFEPIEGFGMYTSGAHLAAVLTALGSAAPGRLPELVRWVLEVHGAGLAADAVEALERLSVYLRANEHHQASDQIGMVWSAVWASLIAPSAET